MKKPDQTDAPIRQFQDEVRARIQTNGENADFVAARDQFLNESIRARYSYNFAWLGRPIIQYPQDIVAWQDIIWRTRPDVIVETGIAHGGSLILSASLLALLDLCDAEAAPASTSRKPARRVIGVDIDIRDHNRSAIESHPMASRITMIKGSSVDPATIAAVRSEISDDDRVLVGLDSHHGHDHVLSELNAYARLVTPGGYCVVFDTVVEYLSSDLAFGRPWGPGDNPMTAVQAWLPDNPDFAVDDEIDHRLMLSVAPRGYLRRREDSR